MELNRIFCTEF
jgi:hypothetical protein